MPEAAAAAAPPPAAGADAGKGTVAPPPGSGAAPLESGEGEAFAGAFEELAALDAAGGAAPPPKGKKKEGAEVVPPKPGDKPAPKPGETPPKPGEKAGAAAPPPDDVEPKSVPELRTAYKKVKEARQELHGKLTAAEARIKELEAGGGKGEADLKPLQDQLEALKQRNAKLEEQIEYTDFSQSEKFKKEYAEPYAKAWAKAIAEVTQLTISYQDEAGHDITRKATDKDLLALANAPLDQVDELAEAWFGRSAARVIRHVERVRDLADAQNTALEEAKSKAGERLKERGETTKAFASKVNAAYEGAKADLAKKFPKWFAHDETDQEGNALWDKGLEFNQSVFASNGKLTPEQKAARLAVVQFKAANHDRLARRLKMAMKDLADAQAALAEYEKSGEPGKPGERAAAGGEKGYLESAFKELESLDNKKL